LPWLPRGNRTVRRLDWIGDVVDGVDLHIELNLGLRNAECRIEEPCWGTLLTE
jgi:hypothetical protein